MTNKTLQSAVFQQKNIFLVSVPRVRLVLPPSQDIWWEKFPLSRPLQSINKSTRYELMGKHEVASQGESTRADIWKMAFAAESRADCSGNVSACDTLTGYDKCDMHVQTATQRLTTDTSKLRLNTKRHS